MKKENKAVFNILCSKNWVQEKLQKNTLDELYFIIKSPLHRWKKGDTLEIKTLEKEIGEIKHLAYAEIVRANNYYEEDFFYHEEEGWHEKSVNAIDVRGGIYEGEVVIRVKEIPKEKVAAKKYCNAILKDGHQTIGSRMYYTYSRKEIKDWDIIKINDEFYTIRSVNSYKKKKQNYDWMEYSSEIELDCDLDNSEYRDEKLYVFSLIKVFAEEY